MTSLKITLGFSKRTTNWREPRYVPVVPSLTLHGLVKPNSYFNEIFGNEKPLLISGYCFCWLVIKDTFEGRYGIVVWSISTRIWIFFPTNCNFINIIYWKQNNIQNSGPKRVVQLHRRVRTEKTTSIFHMKKFYKKKYGKNGFPIMKLAWKLKNINRYILYCKIVYNILNWIVESEINFFEYFFL